MKKVLLTTTALVMTAGVAAAEVSMSGATQVSVSASGNNSNVLNTFIDFDVAVSGASDNGITMSAGFGYNAGVEVAEGDFKTEADATGDFGTADPELTIGYAGYTIKADGEGVTDLYNGDKKTGNLGISGSLGDVAFGVTTNIDGNASVSSYSLGYTMGDLSATLTGSNDANTDGDDATKLALSYAMGDTTITASSDDVDGDETITTIGFSTKMDAVTIAYSAKNTSTAGSSIGDHWDASIAYTAGALTASFALDESDVTKLSASYDLGGGANLFAVMKSTDTAANDFQAVGINFAF